MHVDVDDAMARRLADCLVAADTPVVVVDAVDDLPIVFANAAFETMTGYRANELLGRNCRLLQGRDTDPDAVRTIREQLAAGRPVQVPLLNYRADQTPFWCNVHISPVRDTTGRVVRFISVQHDITTAVTQLREATRAATSDPLTGLMNRNAFAAQTERELLRAARHDRAAGVLFLDIDQFKQVNDTHGHTVGDAYLTHVADTLRTHLRREDTSARHGGDEFTVLLTDLPAGPAAQTAADTAAAHLRSALSQPFTLHGTHNHEHHDTHHRLAVSIGRALFPHDATTVPGLISHADADMYRHKPPPPDD